MVSARAFMARLKALLLRDVTNDRRGVAMLIVLTTVAILGAFSTEFSYNMRVSVRQAGNMRREVQAYYNARSAMEIARAVIFAQQKFQTMLGPMAGNMGNLELWRYACDFARIFATGEVKFLGATLFSLKDQEGIGVDEGSFSCKIEPEDGKIKVSRVGTVEEKSAIFRQLYAVLRRYFGIDSMETKDQEAVDLILNIIDWADADDTRSDIDETGKIIEGTAGEGGAGSGDYSRYGYKARNAKPDSNEELRLIEGMTDELYCDVGKELTIYDTENLNVNTANIEVIKALICEYVQGDMLAVCGLSGAGGLATGSLTPIDYIGELIETCRTIKGKLMMPAFSNPQAFTAIFGKLPAPLNTMVQVNTAQLQKEIGVRARVLRVRALGKVGLVKKRLEAVIDSQGAKYVYWREL